MQPGRLRRRVYLQVPTRVNADGGYTETWANASGEADGKISAAFTPARNDERIVGAEVQAVVAFLATIRYHSSATPRCRLVEGSVDATTKEPLAGARVYQIRGVRDVGDREQWMELAIEEVQP